MPVRWDLVSIQEGQERLEQGDLICLSPLEAVLKTMSVRNAKGGDSPRGSAGSGDES